MKCNFSKCKEMVFRKKGYNDVLETVAFQENCRFSICVKNKLAAANKCLYILRTMRREGHCQAELDKLFSTTVLPKLVYGISVYGSSPPELTTIQCFLDRCHKRRYTSSPFSIINCLICLIWIKTEEYIKSGHFGIRYIKRPVFYRTAITNNQAHHGHARASGT